MEPVEIRRSGNPKHLHEVALVLQAVGIRHRILREGTEQVLVVAAEDAARTHEELALYDRESRGWPPPPEPTRAPRSRGRLAVACYVALLVTFHFLKVEQDPVVDWISHGRADAGAIRDGQWWRTVTALCLHADLVHLLGNLLFGALFLTFACQVLGAPLAGASMLAAGALGNYLNAWLQAPDHASIGASTAVFGALGILVAHRFRTRRDPGYSRSQRWGPFAIGLAFLAFLGTEGERTDVGAHVTGLLAGTAIGLLHGRWGRERLPGRLASSALVALPPAALGLAWWLAWQR